jgi:hypothetical protein
VNVPANAKAIVLTQRRIRPTQPPSVRIGGVPAQRGRTATLRQLVLQMPAPVVAQAFGCHQASTTRIATEAGSPWSGYAPGDHTR